MTHEFNTQYGKIAVERNILFITNPYLPFTQRAVAVLAVDVFWVVLFAIIVFWPEDNASRYWTRVLMWGFMLAIRLPTIYTHFFKTSWASRIPLDRVKGFVVIPNHLNLLTRVWLELDNGRTRKILFRTKGSSLQEFTSLLSAQTAAVPA